jgi:RNA recognition motif-containing protein
MLRAAGPGRLFAYRLAHRGSSGSTTRLTGQLHQHERERLAVRLFIGNLPYDATEAELRGHIAPVGQPLQILVPLDRETGRPRGFAFVEFAAREIAEEVIRRFDGQPFKGRPLAVSEARAREDRPPGVRPPGGYGPRPPRPIGLDPGQAPPRDRVGAPSGPASPPRRQRAAPSRTRAKPERGPKGPIRERTGGRVFDVDDDSPEAEVEFDNFATRASDADESEDDKT